MIAGLERNLLLGPGFRSSPEEGQGNRGQLRNGGHHSISMFLSEQRFEDIYSVPRYIIVEDGALNCPVFLLLRIVRYKLMSFSCASTFHAANRQILHLEKFPTSHLEAVFRQ